MMFNNPNGYYYNWNNMPSYMRNMMQSYYSGVGGILYPFEGVLRFIILILVIVLLISLIRLVWKKGSK